MLHYTSPSSPRRALLHCETGPCLNSYQNKLCAEKVHRNACGLLLVAQHIFAGLSYLWAFTTIKQISLLRKLNTAEQRSASRCIPTSIHTVKGTFDSTTVVQIQWGFEGSDISFGRETAVRSESLMLVKKHFTLALLQVEGVEGGVLLGSHTLKKCIETSYISSGALKPKQLNYKVTTVSIQNTYVYNVQIYQWKWFENCVQSHQGKRLFLSKFECSPLKQKGSVLLYLLFLFYQFPSWRNK